MTWRKNDVGGLPAGPIDFTDKPVKFWQLESEALRKVLDDHINLDELRRSMEDLPQEDYDAGFFDRRIVAITGLLIEKGLLTRDEVDARIAALKEEA